MKRIVLLFALLTALLPIVAQGRELPPEHGSDRTCYSADGTKIYRYYGEDYMVVRQANKILPDLTVCPDWFYWDMQPVKQLYQERKEEFRALGEEFQLERTSIIVHIHISLKTGRYVMSEIVLRKKAVSLSDQLPLDYLFSLFDRIEVNSKILDHDPCEDDNKYTTYRYPIW